jgi:hypothetical protein
MRRYLVVSHQTLASPELLEAMRAKTAEEDTTFHLLVPIHHGEPGLTWTLSHDRAVARRALQDALERFRADGFQVDGEVGGDSPVDGVRDVLLSEGSDAFDGIIVSTLPHTVSKWLKVDAPSRIQRGTHLPVQHVVGHPSHVGV